MVHGWIHWVSVSGARLGGVLVLACGPVTPPPSGGSSDSGGSSNSTTAQIPPASETTAAVTTGSVDSGPSTSGTTSGTTMSSEDDADSGPKLDLWLPDFTGPANPYESCVGAICPPGLSCEVIAQGKDLLYTACTGPCEDPRIDCPPADWIEPICHPLSPEQAVCALPCDEGLCPPQMSCLHRASPVPICAELF